MIHKQSWARRLPIIVSLVFVMSVATAVGTRATVLAQGTDPAAPAPAAQTITYTVQPGDTLTKIAVKYGVTVDELVALNDIENPDLIYVGQVLKIPASAGTSATPAPAPQPTGGPLSFTWSVVSWRPDDPNYIATLHISAQGGTPPYTYYHDGLVQQGDTFEMAWRRCQPKPGSVGVADATGLYVKQDYWLEAPYCPVGIQILQPEEGAHLKNYPRNFNVVWDYTVDPPPGAFGIEIQVWENGGWHAWKEYEQQRDTRPIFFVTDFPGDLAGRVRMWGIYGGDHDGPKTDWRYFEFRVTY
jgi:hypothetical protein